MRYVLDFISHEFMQFLTTIACISAIIFIMMLCGCAAKPADEMERMTKDVLKAKKGIEIIVEPLNEEK